MFDDLIEELKEYKLTYKIVNKYSDKTDPQHLHNMIEQCAATLNSDVIFTLEKLYKNKLLYSVFSNSYYNMIDKYEIDFEYIEYNTANTNELDMIYTHYFDNYCYYVFTLKIKDYKTYKYLLNLQNNNSNSLEDRIYTILEDVYNNTFENSTFTANKIDDMLSYLKEDENGTLLDVDEKTIYKVFINDQINNLSIKITTLEFKIKECQLKITSGLTDEEYDKMKLDNILGEQNTDYNKQINVFNKDITLKNILKINKYEKELNELTYEYKQLVQYKNYEKL